MAMGPEYVVCWGTIQTGTATASIRKEKTARPPKQSARTPLECGRGIRGRLPQDNLLRHRILFALPLNSM